MADLSLNFVQRTGVGMRLFIILSLLFVLQALNHVSNAQEFDITEIVAAQTAYDEAQTETRRAALLLALANYQGDATVETVNAHLTVMSNDTLTGDYRLIRESASAAAAHLESVAEIVPRQYIDSKFVAAIALFNGEKDAEAMREMAHVQGFSRKFRDAENNKPEWATDLQWKAEAWVTAMGAYFESESLRHPDDKEVQGILKTYQADTDSLNAAARITDTETGLPFCPGRITQSPKLRYPAKSKEEGMVGAVILGFDFAADGKVSNPKVLAAVPSDEFDETLLKTVSKWRYRPAKKRDVGVTCKLERSNIVNSFIFLLD